jgi:hypothetical protein
MTPDQELRQGTADSLKRMQDFDVETLAREKEFGEAFNFRGAVPPAKRLIDFYKRLTTLALDDFPTEQLNQIQAAANRDFALFQTILNLDSKQGITPATRDQRINAIDQAYQPTFRELFPLVAFSLHRAADFQQLDRDARAALQAIKDRGDAFAKEAEGIKTAAASALEQAQKAAAEHGVTQQAIYFKEAATYHETEATVWEKTTGKWAVGLGAFAIVSMFLHKIPFLVPTTAYDTVQLAVSKVLIFAVLSYMLYLAARNYLAHRHNAVINKHRQNALMTYTSIAAAAKESPSRDVILTHASACIFAPQSTGYGGDGTGDGSGAKSIVEVFGRVADKA